MKEVPFQINYIEEIADTATKLLRDQYRDKSTIVFKAPTGAGKTYMISQALSKLVKEIGEPLSFIWISVNSLHEQSRQNLERYLENERLLDCISADEILDNTIEESQIVFLNWESLIKKNNVFRLDNENDRNLQTITANTREEGRRIVLIIDESHRVAKAEKAKEVINEISPALTIEMTATPEKITGTLIEIPLRQVIDEGLIKKEVRINPYSERMSKEEGLLDAALERRSKLKEAYKSLGKVINPLLLIQVRDKKTGDAANPEDGVIALLNSRGYTTQKGNLAIWISDKKENKELVELNDSPVDVLIFKQAIAVGWDCPRAAILLLHRKWSEDNLQFNMQTLGRIMRMPEQVHYDDKPELNIGYVYSDFRNADIIKELAGDYVSELQLVRDEDIYERPIKLISEYIRRKVELKRLSSEFTNCLIEAASELDTRNQINPNVTNVQKRIMVDATVEAIDEEQSVIGGREYAYRRSKEELAHNYLTFAREQASGYMVNSSVPSIKRAIRSWFKKEFDDGDEDRVARVVIQARNRPKFKELLELAKEKYGQISERADKVLTNEWEIPEGVNIYKSSYTALEDSNKSIFKEKETQKFYVKVNIGGKLELSKPEAEFIKQLEATDDETQWWFKNGTKDSKYFCIAYQKNDGRYFGFYPDFIIKTKKEVLIVEIKDDNDLANDNLLKLRAGKDYLTRHTHKEKVRFYILSPDDFENFFLSVKNQELDKFKSSFEERILRYFKSKEVVFENAPEETKDSEFEKELFAELDKAIAELNDTKLKNELLEIELSQAQENIKAMSVVSSKEKKETARLEIPKPFNICVLGDVSDADAIMQELQAYFTKHTVKTNDWSIEFVNNTKLKNSNALKSLVKGQSKFNLIITAQIYHHAGKGNSKSNIISELANEKYVPHVVGIDPKSLLTPDRAVESVDKYLTDRD